MDESTWLHTCFISIIFNNNPATSLTYGNIFTSSVASLVISSIAEKLEVSDPLDMIKAEDGGSRRERLATSERVPHVQSTS
jgi:hypothetical protein